MKNKIISAMLVGMSATMAVPVTAVMAAEGEPAATEATAAEAAVTEETPAEEAPTEETQAEETVPENEAEEAQEEEAVPQVDENGEITEAAKDAATPADFREKLSTLSFSTEVFGKYADKLTAYATSDAVDKSNLYNCEMSVLDQAERYANGESGEAIKAIKYQIALEFEKVYGEDAFLPGRDIRKAILEDLGKAQDFTACTTIAEADQIYKDNEGIVALPADMIKKDDGDISVKPNPGEGENKPSTGGDGTGTGTEGETKPELDTYVSGIQDYEIKVGEDIDTSSISYNAEHISSVELDSSKVDNTTVGTYTISYIIKGIDGRVKTIDKQCVVIENSELTALRAEMCAKADVLFEGKFTEQAYAAEWNAALDEAKARINKLGTSDAEKMQGIVDELTKTGQDILDRQQLYIAQTGYVKILKEYYSSLKFETDSQKKMADETLNAAVDKISKATSIDAASKALEDAKAALKDIAEQKETTLDELKEAAKAEINDTDIYTNVYGYDNLYKQVLSQFNTYLKEMVNSLQFTAFTNTILTIGVVLMLFYFFTDLTEKAAMNQLSTLQLGKSFCAALGTIFIMFHSKNIFIFLMNMVESLNDSLTIGARGHMIVSNILTNDITQLLLSRCVAEHFSVWAILGYTLTALLFFQIIVILIICASITFVHNALVVTDENAHKSVNTVVDPAVKLKGSYTADYPEIEIRNMQTTKKQSVAEDKKIEYTSVETSREWKKAEKRTVKKEVTDNDHEDDDENGGTSEAYAKDDFKYFVNHIVDPSTFFISTGIMLSALFLIFRSREISTKLFA